jgi:hypothetical protein
VIQIVDDPERAAALRHRARGNRSTLATGWAPGPWWNALDVMLALPGATRAEVLRMLDIFEQARLGDVPMGKRALNSVNPSSERNLPAFADYLKHPIEYYYQFKTPGFDDL